MITLSNVFRLLELIPTPSPPRALKSKKQKHDQRHQDAGQTISSPQGYSIPEQKMRVGQPPGLSTDGDAGGNDNVNDNPNYLSLPIPSQSDPRRELEAQIQRLWKTVWLGLYQVDNAQGPYHYERIEALYLGAGLTKAYRVGELQALNRHFSEYSRNHGIAGLKLYANLSGKTLWTVVEVLEAYEREIPNLERIYEILRSAQLELDQEDGFGGYNAQIHQTQRRYLSVAEPLEKRLLHYDARMDVLTMDIYDEAMELHDSNPLLRKGMYLYQKVFVGR